MLLYEWSRELLFPEFTRWESHFITIVLSAVFVALISWIILKRRQELVVEVQKHTFEAESARKHLAFIVESSDDAIFSIDTEGRILSWNEGASRIFGLTKDEVLHRSLQILIPPEIPSRISDLIEQTRLKREIRRFDGVFLKSNGNRIHLSITTRLLPDIPGHSGIISVNARDNSDQIAREEMYRLLGLKQQLLAAITTHDINNNLQTLMGYCSLIQEEDLDPETRRIISIIEEQSGSIKGQIAFMREYESLGIKAPVWVRAEDVFSRAIHPFGEKGEIIEWSLSPLEVYADPLIEKVLYNLVDNAFRYGLKLTCIRSYYEIIDEECLWIVEDDGVGVQPELKEKIFLKGFGQTSGLGLYYIREILAITSIGIRETGMPDKGARFEMVIPAGFWRRCPGYGCPPGNQE